MSSIISRHRQTALRLTIAVAASIGLHAAALSLYGPGGRAAASSVSSAPVLHAFLEPSLPQPAAAAPAQLRDGSRGRPGADAGDAVLQGPERWFKRSELDTTAAPIGGVKLDYPEGVKSRQAAAVQVRLFIDERGVVRKIKVEMPGPDRAFDEAAVHAWQRVRFSPAIKDGVAVKSQQVIEVDFRPELALR